MKLSKREYIFVAVGIFVAAAFLVSEFVYQPYWVRHQSLMGEIVRLEEDLKQVRSLADRYRRNETMIADIERRLVRSGDGFSLFSYLEEAAGKAGIGNRLAALTPTQSDVEEGYRKLEMSVHFNELTLGELVRFLEYLDRAPKLIRVDQLRIDRSTRLPGRIKVSAKVVTFSFQDTRG